VTRHLAIIAPSGYERQLRRWVIQDLGSTNGTEVNGVRVGRCELHPGDHVGLGDERLRID
jgi:hypothetical protein